MKTSKIKEIGKTREYDFANKHWYAIKLTMENGDVGEYSVLKKDAFTIGQELDYELKEDQYGNFKMKKASKDGSKKNYNQKEDAKIRMVSFALSYSKDIAIAQINQSGLYSDEALFKLADDMYSWLSNKLLSEEENKESEQTIKENKEDLVTEKQIKLIKTLWTKTGLSEDNIRGWMKENFSVESSKDLKKDQASEFIEQLQKRSEEDEKAPSDEEFPF